MVHDYLSARRVHVLSAKTQKEYRIYLDIFVDRFGDSFGCTRTGTCQKVAHGARPSGGPAGAHALYRTVRAFFGKVRLCYDDVDHPGFVREDRNPFASLDLSLPKAAVIVWPRAAVDAFVALADGWPNPPWATRS